MFSCTGAVDKPNACNDGESELQLRAWCIYFWWDCGNLPDFPISASGLMQCAMRDDIFDKCTLLTYCGVPVNGQHCGFE